MSIVLANLEEDYANGLMSTTVYEAKKAEYSKIIDSQQLSIYDSKCREVVISEEEVAKLLIEEMST